MQHEMEEIKPFSVRYQRKALYNSIFRSLAFAALMGYWGWDSWQQPIKTIVNFVGIYLGAPLGIGCIILMIGAMRRLASRQSALEINKEGIRYQPMSGGVKRIFWSEIGAFVIREQDTDQSKSRTVIDIVAKTSVPRALISIPIKDLSMPDSDELCLTVDYLRGELERFSSLRVNAGQKIAVADRRVAPSRTTSLEKVWGWVLGVIITLCISAGSRIASQQANTAIIKYQKEAFIDDEMKRFDDAMTHAAMFNAVKQVDPEAYKQFRQSIRDKLVAGGTQQEFNRMSAAFGKQFVQRRLKHATPITLEKYVRMRIMMCEKAEEISPEALYEVLAKGADWSNLPENIQAALMSEFDRYDDNTAEIITAPLAEAPLPQDTNLVNTRFRELFSRLDPSEREVILNYKKPNVDKAMYCKAVLHLYRSVLGLPVNESVQIFRMLKVIPQDDRNVSMPAQ